MPYAPQSRRAPGATPCCCGVPAPPAHPGGPKEPDGPRANPPNAGERAGGEEAKPPWRVGGDPSGPPGPAEGGDPTPMRGAEAGDGREGERGDAVGEPRRLGGREGGRE